jgi:hypothetical protein
MTTTEPSGRGTLRTILLACGILSSLLYVATDLLGGMSYEGYSMAPYSALHVRGAEWTISDTLHIVVTSVMVLSILLAVGFDAVALGPRFLRYSFGTLLVLVVSLATIGVYGPRLAAQLPTPGLGDRRARQRLRVSSLGRRARD